MRTNSGKIVSRSIVPVLSVCVGIPRAVSLQLGNNGSTGGDIAGKSLKYLVDKRLFALG